MNFQFISSGDGSSWEILDYGTLYHGARLEICYRPPTLYYGDGRKRLNYTEAEYNKWMVDTAGYMHWHRSEPIPWEIVRQFKNEREAEAARCKAKYPDVELGDAEILGRWYIAPDDWSTPIIEPFPAESEITP